MKLLIKHTLVGVAYVLALALPISVYATNGMNLIGYGAKATAMGGAGIAYPQDAMAVAYNPASMTEVGQFRFDATIELFTPPRAVAHQSATLGSTDTDSHDNLFPIPALAIVMSDQSTPLSMGMAMVGAGLGTNYDQPPTNAGDPCVPNFYNPCITSAPYKKVGVFLMQMQMLPSMAYRLNENHSIGASLVIAMQTFTAFGLEAFVDLGFTNDTSGLTNNGHDWGYGFGYKLGWFSKFFDQRLNMGLTYSPRVEMQKFNRYTGLFANHGEFDIPPSYGIGFAFKLTPKSNVAFDVVRIEWADVDSIGNLGPNATILNDQNPNGICGVSPANPTGVDSISPDCKLGGDLGMGFGWQDQTVYKLGVDYKWSDTLILRGGLNYAESPIQDDQVLFNMLAPATVEWHATFGFSKALSKQSEFSLTIKHAFENTIKGPTAFPPPATQGDNAALTMSQTSLGLAYGLRY